MKRKLTTGMVTTTDDANSISAAYAADLRQLKRILSDDEYETIQEYLLTKGTISKQMEDARIRLKKINKSIADSELGRQKKEEQTRLTVLAGKSERVAGGINAIKNLLDKRKLPNDTRALLSATLSNISGEVEE